MALDNQSVQAVDRLCMMFPTIERPQIQKILINDCGGDATKAIVILSKVQEFNKAMNNNAGGGTANSGEAISGRKQQIPLQVVQQPQVIQQAQVAPRQDDCCGECGGCDCCAMKPASYKSGLYKIDYSMYHYSFLILFLSTVYPEASLQSLEFSAYGLYLPLIGLIMIAIACCMGIFIDMNNKIFVEAQAKASTIRGALFIFGGLFYFLGYCVHAGVTPQDDDWDDWWWWRHDIYPKAEYLIGRGMFIGFHAIFIGYLFITKNKLPQFCKDNGGERIQLIRLWTLLLLLYLFLVLGTELPYYFWIIYAALSPFVLVITLFLNCCLLKKSNEAGGCNSGVSLGLIIVISYYFMHTIVGLFIFGTRLSYDRYYDEPGPGWYILYEFGLYTFVSMQLWIMLRAMHPVNANCGCTQDGSGDGAVMLTAGNVVQLQQVQQVQVQQQQPTQVVMVVQQPQQTQQVVQTIVVPTAAVANKTDGGDDDDDDVLGNEDEDDEELFQQDEDNELMPTKGGEFRE